MDDNFQFHRVVPLRELGGSAWEEVRQEIPKLPRGWFELSRLPQDDRVALTSDYWFAKLPFMPVGGLRLEERLADFFEMLEDIDIFATQASEGMPYDVHMVYSLQGDVGFFHGYPPATPESVANLARQFGNFQFPPDYLAFLEIHDGFSKVVDRGILRTKDLAKVYGKFQQELKEETLITGDGLVTSPRTLLPFYESYGVHTYQCFHSDWYPSGEMGTLYYEEEGRIAENYLDLSRKQGNRAVPTFLQWLIHYLEDLSHV